MPGIGSAWMVSSQSGLLIGNAPNDNGLDMHGLYDARTGRPVLGSPSYALLGFSPSGQFVVGYRGGPATGGGPPSVVVVADVETGDIVRAFRLRLYDTGIPVWEDGHTFLMQFVRLALDGTVERPRLLESEPSGCCSLLPAPVS